MSDELVEVTEKLDSKEELMDLSLLNSELLELKEIFSYTQQLVNDSGPKLEKLEVNMDNVHNDVTVNQKELEEAGCIKKGILTKKMLIATGIMAIGFTGGTLILVSGGGTLVVGAMAAGAIVAGLGSTYII